MKALQNLKRTKSPGLDGIPPGMHNGAANYIAEPLTYIIKLSLSTGMIPSSWKEAKVLTMFKSGSSSVMDNYRPILVLPAVSKILEHTVHGSIFQVSERDCIDIAIPQFGFRRKYSTMSLAFTYLTDTIRKSMDKGELTGAIFVDSRKAFDTVDHCRLIEKLKNYGVIETELDWFTDYLFNRHQTVIYDCHKQKRLFSAVFPMNMNDIQEGLDKDMNAVASWLNQNQLVISLNEGKTESMFFVHHKNLKKKEGNPELTISAGANQIRSTLSYKYLAL